MYFGWKPWLLAAWLGYALWGPRTQFYYTFSYEFEKRLPGLSRNNGFYYSDESPWLGHASAFMAHHKVFARRPDGLPQFHNNHAFHIENKKLVGWLENRCRDQGVVITDATVRAEKGPAGIAALVTESGDRITGDLYVDASGFRSELLGRALGEPFRDYQDALFCDRAVIGGWPRTSDARLVRPCQRAITPSFSSTTSPRIIAPLASGPVQSLSGLPSPEAHA